MAIFRGLGNRSDRPLGTGWQMVVSEAGQFASPSDIPAAQTRIAASVPGTVAQALEAAGRFDRTSPVPLDHRDFWYLLDLPGESPGPARLVLEGLATVCEIFLNGGRIAESRSQFVTHDLAVTLTGSDRLAIAFRAMTPHLKASGPRAKWRPQMITPPGMRMVRATLLGHMPGWCPDIHAIGPWRPVHLIREGGIEVDDLRVNAALSAEGEGLLDLSFRFSGRAGDLRILCGDASAPVTIAPEGRLHAALTLATVTPWWPHTHGRPRLYPLSLVVDGRQLPLGRVGFRTIGLDRGPDGRGFGITVNGAPVFCRGAVWTSADIARLPGGRADYEPWLRLARDAGMNMIRIGGTMAYETRDFFDLCDELGIMVWQDFMFANFDYPAADPDFASLVRREAEDLLSSLQGSPSLTVLCGGSEIHQQAAMMGLPAQAWSGPLTEEILPSVHEAFRPDVVYVPNTPYGGAMPFSPNAGITHYYGVGAYCRPLDDARRARVRFSAESLAFAQVPEQATLDEYLPVAPVHHPAWKARVPRDRGASWDFEDIRDHYLQDLYGLDPARLRREDPSRYLDLSRAATVEVTETTYAEWRRPGSTCRGALVWTLQDLLPGPGWGVIDSTGLPKPVWHGLRRAFRPVQLLMSDEGTNGLFLHAINETDATLPMTIEVSALRDGMRPVVSGRRELLLKPGGEASLAATDIFGAFFDTTYAFRFGPPAHDVTVARLMAGENEIASAFHFPRGHREAIHAATIVAEAAEDADGPFLVLSSDRLAQSVNLSVPGYLPDDNWFHLAPSVQKTVRLAPFGQKPERPGGEIRHLGASTATYF
ncbi:MAG: glycoside hydrolase family 2 protein [Rhizobiaceae bacterium]|nr:glycoside hydrolase family 2 protein [Rhizobiaceae bacterium]